MPGGVDVDPDKLPPDWRSVVRTGAFVILLGGSVMAIGAIVASPVAKAEIAPVLHRLDVLDDSVSAHMSKTEALIPVMERTVTEQAKINCGIARNIFELCRLTPGARCVPMGASCQ